MDTESPNVCSRFAADPKHTKVPFIIELIKLALVNSSNTELTLDSRNQWWALEKGTGQSLKSPSKLGFTTRDLVMKADHTHIFFSRALLRLHQASCPINADDQTAGNLRVKSATMASLFGSILNERTLSGFSIGCV